jgi:hypothetical protein
MSITRHSDPPAGNRAGWYPDDSPQGQRYFDGTQWTDATPAPAPAPRMTAEPVESGGAIVGLGYVFALLMPIIGLILGIIAATRPQPAKSKHGPWIIALSVIGGVIGVLVVLHLQAGGGAGEVASDPTCIYYPNLGRYLCN